MNKKVNVLGTEYTIEYRNSCDDEHLGNNADGYCDKTAKLIVIANKDSDCELQDFEYYQKQCIRHEIIHAFMFESGLANDWQHPEQYGHDETTVDWIAIQFPKMMKAFEEADCL